MEFRRKTSGSSVSRYVAEIAAFPRLDAERERDLARQARAGNPQARTALVQASLRFVVPVACEYGHLGVALEDLIHEGNLGLIEATHRFDPERGIRFVTYARFWIRKAILGALGDHAKVTSLSSYRREQLERLREARRLLEQSLGREPSHEEIEQHLGWSSKALGRLLRSRLRFVSADESLESGGPRRAELLPDPRSTSPEKEALHTEAIELLGRAMTGLTIRERMVLACRYGDPGRSLEETGRLLGVSRERVRQIEAGAVESLGRVFRRGKTAVLAPPKGLRRESRLRVVPDPSPH